MDRSFLKQTDEYKQSSKIQKLWYDLSFAMHNVHPGESILERISSPWDSKDEEIMAAWSALTSPENMELLKQWEKSDMNPRAREATSKAIEHCDRRLKERN